MIQLPADGVRVLFIVAAVTVTIRLVVFAQATESDVVKVPVASEQGPADADAAIGDNESQIATSAQAVTPPKPAISGEVDVEIQNRLNEIRSELLDERANTIDWWLAVTALVLTFFGIVVVIAGFFGYRRFQEILNEAREGAKAAAEHAEIAVNHAKVAERRVMEIENIRDKSREILEDLNAQSDYDSSEHTNQVDDRIQFNSEASLMDRAVASAAGFQKRGETEKAVEKWRAIANIAEESDNVLAAKAWNSIAYLIRNESLEKSIAALHESIRHNPDNASAYYNRGTGKIKLNLHEAAISDFDEAIRLNPDHAFAYNNRGTAKARLDLHDSALADFEDAIRLNPNSAPAFNNRGNAKARLNQQEAALTDYDEAIRLNPGYALAFNNRGNAKARLNQQEAALADYDEAIRLNPNYARAYYNRGIVWLLRKGYDKAKSDLAEATNRNIDIVAAFRRDHNSVADFEKRNGVKVPEGIKRMVEP